MKLFNFKKHGTSALGICIDNKRYDLTRALKAKDLKTYYSIDEVITKGAKDKLASQIDKLEFDETIDEKRHILPAILNPEKILCVGLNYQDHIDEVKDSPQAEVPTIFSKFNNTLIGAEEPIPYPTLGTHIDYEVELVVIIGETVKNISEDDVMDAVFGYTIGNDLSLRDRQFATSQWLMGKSQDGFAPVGPYVVIDQDFDPSDLAISCTVNGEIKQSSRTSQMIFKIPEIISYLSKHVTLKPGDLIFTGTPHGVIAGYPEAEQVWLKSGDEMILSIEGIGELKNTIA